MRTLLALLCLLLACALPLTGCSAAESASNYPDENWHQIERPEDMGWSSQKLASARAFSERIGSAAVMIVDRGVVIGSWGDIDRNFLCHSMRKSLMSALYGIYEAEGKIDLSSTLAELGIDDKTPLSEMEKQATVADLLKSRSGIYLPASGEAPEMKAGRPERGSHEPGTFWYYNNWDFNVLGTIFDQLSGEKDIYQAFKDRIADAIGMQEFHPEVLKYEYSPYSEHPYYNFRMSARDLARFGLLFLNEGRWQDQQIIPADWVRESTTSNSQLSANSGYGYMWWTGEKDGLLPGVDVGGHGFMASGWGGHRLIVLPEHDLVIVHRADTFVPRTVDERKIGALLWMILDAAGEKNTGESPVMWSAKGVRLSGESLRAALVESVLEWTVPAGTVQLTHAQDGSLAMTLNGQVVDRGNWSVEDDRYCMEQDSEPGQEHCGYLLRDGDVVNVYDEVGLISFSANLAGD